MLGTRHARQEPAALYAAAVMPDAVLAYLGRQGWTVVVNPVGPTNIRLLEQLPDPRAYRLIRKQQVSALRC